MLNLPFMLAIFETPVPRHPSIAVGGGEGALVLGCPRRCESTPVSCHGEPDWKYTIEWSRCEAEAEAEAEHEEGELGY